MPFSQNVGLGHRWPQDALRRSAVFEATPRTPSPLDSSGWCGAPVLGVVLDRGSRLLLAVEAPCRPLTEQGFEEFVLARRGAAAADGRILLPPASHADAEDLVQAALHAGACRRWTRIADRPEPYVRQVLARESVSRWRSRQVAGAARRRGPRAGGRPRDGRPTAGWRFASAALLSLPPRQRAVIVLRYYEDLTEKQTAAPAGDRGGHGEVAGPGRPGAGCASSCPGLDVDAVEGPSTVPNPAVF